MKTSRIDDATMPLAKLRFSKKQEFFWTDAGIFFRWCRHELQSCVENLSAAAREEFETGRVPQELLTKIHDGLSRELKSNLVNLPSGAFEEMVIRALPNERDRAKFWNNPSSEWLKLPMRIRAAVGNGLKEGFAKHHDAFFRKVGDVQMVEYVRAWQSRDQARLRLMIEARGEVIDPKGTISIGPHRINTRAFVLNEAKSSKRTDGHGIPNMLFHAALANDTRFFIRLGKVLQSKKTTSRVDWNRCNDIERMLVDNWCGWEWALGLHLPPLCLFTAQALADFCSAAFGNDPGDPSVDTVWQYLANTSRGLALHQASHPTIRELDFRSLKLGELLFIPGTS